MSWKKFALVAVVLFVGAVLFSGHRADRRDGKSPNLSTQAFQDEPVQQDTRRDSFEFKGYKVIPLATFAIRARVMAAEHYRFDAGAKLSPIDLALGWQCMSDPAVYRALNITQSNRWYRYSWSTQPPIPRDEIVRSSANMHLIPANEAVESALERAGEGDFVRIKGYLVEVLGENGWKWRSSLARTDEGMGSCELIYVEAAEVEKN